jgi:hypothetical protein
MDKLSFVFTKRKGKSWEVLTSGFGSVENPIYAPIVYKTETGVIDALRRADAELARLARARGKEKLAEI